MKLAPLAFHSASSVEEATSLLDRYEGEAKPLAGGQSLMPLLAMRIARPAAVIDINPIPELALKRFTSGELIIGAMVRERAIESDERINSRCGAIADAIPLIGHVGIRNRGTVGGSIAHADSAAEWPALCLLLDGVLEATSSSGVRRIGAEEFFQGFLTVGLDSRELLTKVHLQMPGPNVGTAFKEITRRHGDFAIVGLGALLALDEAARIQNARIVVCGVASTPVRANSAEQLLIGQKLSAQVLTEAAEAVAADINPPPDLLGGSEYRKQISRVLVHRVLPLAAQRAELGR